jgi:hypothetical protein
VKNKNIKCAKQKQRQNFIMLKYENLNMKRPKQGYGSRSYLKMVLNILKVVGVVPLFMPFWGVNSRKLAWKFPCAHQPTKFLEIFPIYKWIKSELRFNHELIKNEWNLPKCIVQHVNNYHWTCGSTMNK